MDETVLELVRQHMRDVKVATAYDRVYKDECMFCFATSESPGGLYINLKTFQAFDEEHVDLDQERTGCVLYLHEQAHRVRELRARQGRLRSGGDEASDTQTAEEEKGAQGVQQAPKCSTRPQLSCRLAATCLL